MKYRIEMDYNTPYQYERTGLEKYVVGVDLKLGGDFQDGDFLPDGRLELSLNNDSEIFNPLNTDSPYHDKLIPNTRIKFWGDGELLFTGRLLKMEPSVGRDKITRITFEQGLKTLWNKQSLWKVQQNVKASEMIEHLLVKSEWLPSAPDNVFLLDSDSMLSTAPVQTTWSEDSGLQSFPESDFVASFDFRGLTAGACFVAFRFTGGDYGFIRFYQQFSEVEVGTGDLGNLNAFTLNDRSYPVRLMVSGDEVAVAYGNDIIFQETLGLSDGVDYQVFFSTTSPTSVDAEGSVTLTFLPPEDAFFLPTTDTYDIGSNMTIELWERSDQTFSLRGGEVVLTESGSTLTLQDVSIEIDVDTIYTFRAFGRRLQLWGDGVVLIDLIDPSQDPPMGLDYIGSGVVTVFSGECFVSDIGSVNVERSLHFLSDDPALYWDVDETDHIYTYITNEWEQTDRLQVMIGDLLEAERAIGYLQRDGSFKVVDFTSLATADGELNNLSNVINGDEEAVKIRLEFGDKIYNTAKVSYYEKQVTEGALLWEGEATVAGQSEEEVVVTFSAERDEDEFSAIEVYSFVPDGSTTTPSEGVSVAITERGAKKATLRVINGTGGTLDIVINVRGVSLTSKREKSAELRDVDSIIKFRDTYDFTHNNQLVESFIKAKEIAQRVLLRYANPVMTAKSISLRGTSLPTLKIGDYVQINVPSQDFTAPHFISGESHRINGENIESSYQLKNLRSVSMFVLGISQLNSSEQIL